MNLIKSLTVFSLSSLLALNVANAAEKPVKPQPVAQKSAKAQPQPKAKAQPPTKAKEAPKAKKEPTKKNAQQVKAVPADPNLQQFNKSVGLQFVQRGVVVEKDNKQAVTLRYIIENRSNTDIKSMTWIGVYLVGKETIFAQEIPLNFNQPLKAKSKQDITIKVPVVNLPERARQYFLSQNANITTVSGARNVTFVNGQQINVK